jgi:hypothetical protein
MTAWVASGRGALLPPAPSAKVLDERGALLQRPCGHRSKPEARERGVWHSSSESGMPARARF